jgi:glutaredoxin
MLSSQREGARKEQEMYQREVVLYTRSRSLKGWRAKRFLRHLGCRFEVIDTTGDPKVLVDLSKAISHKVNRPYIFVDHRPVGGMGTVRALVSAGQFDHLLCDNL